MQTIQLQVQKIVNLEIVCRNVIHGQAVVKSVEFRDVMAGSPYKVIVELDMYDPIVKVHDEGN